MSREWITSRTNPLMVRLRKLNGKRSARRAEGVMVGEGPKLLEEAVAWGAQLETVVCAQGVALPDLPACVRVVEVPQDLLESIADTQSPQGVLFVCRVQAQSLPSRPEGSRYLVLDGIQDPGNLGTIWRTADAFAADGLILAPGCADPWSPKAVRGTMGAAFRLPVYEDTLEGAAGKLAAAGIPLYATALRDDTEDLRQVPLHRAAVIIGSEGRGVSQASLDLCQKTVKIPMSPRCESLNAAAAATVVLWEMSRGLL